jgi:RNA polymerase sigma factor (sigma-70 family)
MSVPEGISMSNGPAVHESLAMSPLKTVLRHIHALLGESCDAALSDAHLLERFRADHDEAAFAELVRRHGPLVLNVCWQVLHHDQDAEDAFQATFFVLARKAASIRKGESLACWLYGIALRTAMNVKRTAARRRARERHATSRAPEQPPSEAALRELQMILHEEVHRLPEILRIAFILCCLQGRSRPEAAQELGWKEGTVSSRVAQARQRLRQGLARRGITLPAALCAIALAARRASATLTAATAHAAVRFASGQTLAGIVSAPAATLAERVIQAMCPHQLQRWAGWLLAVSLLVGGASWAGHHVLATQPEASRAERAALAASAPPGKSHPSADDVQGLKAVVDLDIERSGATKRASGLRVLVDRDGYILTANAALKGASRVRVSLSDGRILEARPIVADESAGLALIQLETRKGLPSATEAPGKSPSVGEGLSLPGPLSRGNRPASRVVVTATGREVKLDQDRTLDRLIQIDSGCQPGAPLMGRNGELVGICIHARSTTASIGFAVPAKSAFAVYAKLKGQVGPKAVVVKTAEEIGQADVKGDCAKLVDLTYTKVVEATGGREKWIAVLQESRKHLATLGVVPRSIKVGEPGDFLTEGENTFVVVPTTIEMTAPRGKLVGKSYLLGISSDKGKTWRFVDGSELNHKEGARAKALPKLPANLKRQEVSQFEYIEDKCLLPAGSAEPVASTDGSRDAGFSEFNGSARGCRC